MSKLEALRDTVLSHPLHAACALELLNYGDGWAELRFAVNDFSANPQGALHGGVLYAIMDVSCFFAVMTQLPHGQHAVSVEVHTSVLRAARSGEKVTVRASVDRIGRTLAAMRCEAHVSDAASEPRLIATGSVTKAIIASPPGPQ